MSFYGKHFSFDNIPCEEYGLMMYDFGAPQDAGGAFSSSGTILEDRVARRHRSLYYGTALDKPLELAFTFGANNAAIDSGKFLDRWDMEAISSWLTNKGGYRWLEVEQPDMETIRYRCIVKELRYMTAGWEPWAFECKAVCDSPYAYTFPETFSFRADGVVNAAIHSRSTHNGYYMPKMRLRNFGSASVSIANSSDGGRVFAFDTLPNSSFLDVEVDNENCVIKSNFGTNLYPFFNFNFFRLVRGDNNLSITGNCDVDFICEFPVNAGS
jgi:hypothetical protein